MTGVQTCALPIFINGEDPKDIGAVFFEDPTQFELWFNLDVAKKLGINIDERLLSSAAVLFKDGKKIQRK